MFQGLRVVDYSWAIAAPWTVKYLADHGATVIHVETISHPDIIRAGPPFKDNKPGIDNSVYFANYHTNKYSLSLNMNHPSSREITIKLISWADVVIENFTPGVMRRWGLSYSEVKQVKPAIIMLSSSQFGQTGPLAPMPGTGVQLTAYAGFNYITGWADREPCVLYGGYTDCPAARFGAIALIAALLYRRKTGKGMYIDLSQYESGLHLLSPVLMDYQLHGRVALRDGNRHPFTVPHGIYPCHGDNWCAIAVFTGSQWEGLCRAMGNPEWSRRTRFSTFMKRKENEFELDQQISNWTASLTAEEVMHKLQEKAVPAGIAQKSGDLYHDPQLKHRGYFWEQVDHPVIGRHLLESHALRLSKTPCRLKMPSPCMGEHTEYVCREILKLSDEQFVELLSEGVFE